MKVLCTIPTNMFYLDLCHMLLYEHGAPKCVWLLDYLHFTGESICNCGRGRKAHVNIVSIYATTL